MIKVDWREISEYFLKSYELQVWEIALYDLNLDQCSPNNEPVCKHGGKCIVQESGNVSCDCSVLFEGHNCETSKFDCFEFTITL